MDKGGGCGLRTTCRERGAHSWNPLPAQARGARCRRDPARLSQQMRRNQGNRNGQGGAGPNGPIMPGPAQAPPPRSSLPLQAALLIGKFQSRVRHFFKWEPAPLNKPLSEAKYFKSSGLAHNVVQRNAFTWRWGTPGRASCVMWGLCMGRWYA